MDDGLHVGQRVVDAGQVGAGNGVDEHGASAGAAELDKEGPVPVAETRGPLGVHGYWPSAIGEPLGGGSQRIGGPDERRQAVARLEQRHCLCARCGVFVGARLFRGAGHGRRRERGGRSALTPGGSGAGRTPPESSHQAAMCPSNLGGASVPAMAGDQDARSSNSVSTGWSSFLLRTPVTTRVTVPLTCR